jgi:hypothetical protein
LTFLFMGFACTAAQSILGSPRPEAQYRIHNDD